jgi:hypothetical protein
MLEREGDMNGMASGGINVTASNVDGSVVSDATGVPEDVANSLSPDEDYPEEEMGRFRTVILPTPRL